MQAERSSFEMSLDDSTLENKLVKLYEDKGPVKDTGVRRFAV